MDIAFTNWQQGTYTTTGQSFTLDWTSPDTLRHAPLLPVAEALRQAIAERYSVSGLSIPSILSTPVTMHGANLYAVCTAIDAAITALIPTFVNYEDNGGDWTGKTICAPPWNLASILAKIGATSRILTVRGSMTSAAWARQAYEILHSLVVSRKDIATYTSESHGWTAWRYLFFLGSADPAIWATQRASIIADFSTMYSAGPSWNFWGNVSSLGWEGDTGYLWLNYFARQRVSFPPPVSYLGNLALWGKSSGWGGGGGGGVVPYDEAGAGVPIGTYRKLVDVANNPTASEIANLGYSDFNVLPYPLPNPMPIYDPNNLTAKGWEFFYGLWTIDHRVPGGFIFQ